MQSMDKAMNRVVCRYLWTMSRQKIERRRGLAIDGGVGEDVAVDGRASEDVEEAVAVIREGPREGKLHEEEAGWRARAREVVGEEAAEMVVERVV